MFRKLYFSPLGYLISGFLRFFAGFHRPFMAYGYFNRVIGRFQKYTRISSSAKLIHKKSLDLGNHVWIGHYCLVDGTGGLTIGEGTQISSHTVIYSHSSQDAIRILGKDFIKIEAVKRPGYKLKPVKIGAYTFVGTSCVILPGASIGKGCLIGAGSLVRGNIPDYAIASGNPLKIIGDTRERDKERFGDLIEPGRYYDPESIS
ncbi:MAG: acyltransferase [Bacteroidales bacterium]|nr:acyltransferase [Bacteroidales bacterium]